MIRIRFCRNLIEWRRTECDNWAKEVTALILLLQGRIEQKSQIMEVALLNQLISRKADHTADHSKRTEADSTSGFYIDSGLSLGWTGH